MNGYAPPLAVILRFLTGAPTAADEPAAVLAS